MLLPQCTLLKHFQKCILITFLLLTCLLYVFCLYSLISFIYVSISWLQWTFLFVIALFFCLYVTHCINVVFSSGPISNWSFRIISFASQTSTFGLAGCIPVQSKWLHVKTLTGMQVLIGACMPGICQGFSQQG